MMSYPGAWPSYSDFRSRRMTHSPSYQNRVTLTGVVETPVATRTRPGGNCVAHLTLATRERWQRGDMAHEHKELRHVVVHDHLASIAVAQLNAGEWVTVEGHIRTRAWTGRRGRGREARGSGGRTGGK